MEKSLVDKLNKHKEVFKSLLEEAGLFDRNNEGFYVRNLTSHGFDLYINPRGGYTFSFTVYYSIKYDNWVISCLGEDGDNSEGTFINMDDVDLYRGDVELDDCERFVPIQERGKGFNNLIESLIGGQWTMFYDVSWDSREKYFDK